LLNSFIANRLAVISYQARVQFAKGCLYFDRTECRRHGGISTAPHDAL